MRSLVIVFLLLSGYTANSSSNIEKGRLVGEWECIEIGIPEPSDYILLHSSGRYTIFNDMDGMQPFPIVEKGNWCFDPEKLVIKLSDREVIQEDAGFVKWHKSYDPIIMHVDSLSEKTMQLSYTREDKRIVEEYQRVIRKPRVKATFASASGLVNQLVLSSPKALLKINYHFPAPSPSQLIITDPEGNELFRTEKCNTQTPQHHEILLADLPNAAELTSLTFEVAVYSGSVHTYSPKPWQVEVELY